MTATHEATTHDFFGRIALRTCPDGVVVIERDDGMCRGINAPCYADLSPKVTEHWLLTGALACTAHRHERHHHDREVRRRSETTQPIKGLPSYLGENKNIMSPPIGSCADQTLLIDLDRIATRCVPRCPGCGRLVPLQRLLIDPGSILGLTECALGGPLPQAILAIACVEKLHALQQVTK